MARRLFLIVLILVLGIVAFAEAYTHFSKGKSSTTTQTLPRVTAHHKAPVTSKWDGGLSRQYGQATFVHGGQELTLEEIDFSGMDGQVASAKLLFEMPRPAQGVKPSWLHPLTFTLHSISGQSYLPTVRNLRVSGQTDYLTVIFRGLSTVALGDDDLSLRILTPTVPFSIILAPPAPPAGHTYAEVQPPPKPKVVHRHHPARKTKRASAKKRR